MLLAAVVLVALVGVFVVRLVDIQVVRAAELSEEAEGRRSTTVTEYGARGDIVDANGNRVGDLIMAAGNSPAGHGWADYVWPRPGQTTPVAKSSYVVRVAGPDGTQYIVGSGGYDLK